MARILVVDDDPTMCMIISRLLEYEGHVCTTCTDGALAIRSILDQKPDLVLLDLVMPYIDGFEMLKALRGDPLTRELLVMVVSSRTDLESLGRVAALRANGFVFKPIRGEELVESVRRVLSEHAA